MIFFHFQIFVKLDKNILLTIMPDLHENINDLDLLATKIKAWGNDLGFQKVSIVKPDLKNASHKLKIWLDQKYHGSMDWMEKHGEKRYVPEKLVERTVRVISLRMNYLSDNKMIAVLKDDNKAYISRYALGSDYHKIIRKKLSTLAKQIEKEIPTKNINQRAFVDSAPVLEKPIAAQGGLGWIGKNTLLIDDSDGSWFFLGEIYTSIPLPPDNKKTQNLCGKCNACLRVCPTNAFPEPYVLDAKKCISYQTIENKREIPIEIRPLMGNRVFGCDDCQIWCPWNRQPSQASEDIFKPKHNLDNESLLSLFNWSELEFNEKTLGSPIKRIGYERWLRNLAVGLGNAPGCPEILESLKERKKGSSPLLEEHISWAIDEQIRKLSS